MGILGKGLSSMCLIRDGSEDVWNFSEVSFNERRIYGPKHLHVSLKEIVTGLWLAKPWLRVSSGD